MVAVFCDQDGPIIRSVSTPWKSTDQTLVLFALRYLIVIYSTNSALGCRLTGYAYPMKSAMPRSKELVKPFVKLYYCSLVITIIIIVMYTYYWFTAK